MNVRGVGRGALVAALCAVAWPAVAAPTPGEADAGDDARGAAAGDGFLADAAERAAAAMDVVRRALPEPLRLTWQKRHLGDVALSGPLLDLAAADLTGDGRAEILALAPNEAVVIARRDPGALAIVGRATFDELELAAIRPRDPVGSAAIVGTRDGIEWWVRSSERADAAVLAWRDGGLVALRRERGYPICPGVALALAEGRNTFEAGDHPRFGAQDEPLHGARCRRDLVGPAGTPQSMHAWVSAAGVLEVALEPRCSSEARCEDEQTARVEGRGYAMVLSDLDRDGHPEVAAAARRPPGEPGEVAVWSLQQSELSPVYRAEFSGPVGGIASGDINGDGREELLVAVRAVGRHRVELWTLT